METSRKHPKIRLGFKSDVMLRFMEYLRIHLKPGTFRPAYCDTDSMAIGIAGAADTCADMSTEDQYRVIFDPVVRPEMKSSWEKSFKVNHLFLINFKTNYSPGLLLQIHQKK